MGSIHKRNFMNRRVVHLETRTCVLRCWKKKVSMLAELILMSIDLYEIMFMLEESSTQLAACL